MKLSERFDRRYQQTPLATPVMPVAPSPNGPPAASAPAPPAAPARPAAPAPMPMPMPPVQPPSSTSRQWTHPTLATAAEKRSTLMLTPAQIDINSPAPWALLLQLTEEHFRAKPLGFHLHPADPERRSRCSSTRSSASALEALLRDLRAGEVMVNRPEQIF